MGDVIHTLPAISDAALQIPDIQFDWVVDRAFAEIPHWHSCVNTVITSAHRQWKRQPMQSLKQGEIKRFFKQLRQTRYDVVIDAQSSLKSAVIARLAAADTRAGMDADSVREYGAHWCYQKRHAVAKQQHAVTRIRKLFAASLDYPVPDSPPVFNIESNKLENVSELTDSPYLLFVPNASWESKCYPEAHWRELIALAVENFSVLIPWGSEAERIRAEKISADHQNAVVLPRMRLSQLAYLIQHARGIITVDTGLGHLAAALAVPALSLYGPTDPQLIGTVGEHQLHLQTSLPCVPCYKRQCHYQGSFHQRAVCLQQLSPDQVWLHFKDNVI